VAVLQFALLYTCRVVWDAVNACDNQPFCVQGRIGILRASKLLSASFLESRIAFDQPTVLARGIAKKTVALSGLGTFCFSPLIGRAAPLTGKDYFIGSFVHRNTQAHR
jgi:hypothetical protein